jgi:ribosome biogenesis GTPase
MVKVPAENELSDGFVLRAESGRFLVHDGERVVPCRLRGRIKKEKLRQVRNVVVGDRVLIRLTGTQPHPESEGVIEKLLPRQNQLSRASPGGAKREQVLMANLDCVFVVMSTREPEFNPRLLDRFLVAIAHQSLDGVIILNKCELAADAVRFVALAPYKVAGYRILQLSAETGEGLESLREEMTGKSSLFLGPSGAGKSTLLRALQPGLEIAIRRVSGATGKGRHTTSYTEMHRLDVGGYVADSPGVREFGLWGMEDADLPPCFPEFRPFLGHCRYQDCSHSHEPRCGIRAAVEEHSVDPRRYESYLRILESIREGRLSF